MSILIWWGLLEGSGKGAGDTWNIFHELDIPNNQAAGTYSVGITVTATT